MESSLTIFILSFVNVGSKIVPVLFVPFKVADHKCSVLLILLDMVDRGLSMEKFCLSFDEIFVLLQRSQNAVKSGLEVFPDRVDGLFPS